MIIGRVSHLEPRIGVVFRFPNRPDMEIEFVVDTGFAGYLTLPPAAVAVIGLPYIYDLNANLADDSAKRVDVHSATILWNGQEIEVDVLAMGKRPLLGTLLMDGFDLGIQFADNGLVTMEHL